MKLCGSSAVLSPTKVLSSQEMTILKDQIIIIRNDEKIVGELPKQNVTPPLEKGGPPELDYSKLLNAEGTEIYISMIGALQWTVTIGCLDINTAVMTLPGFCVAPRHGHLDRAKKSMNTSPRCAMPLCKFEWMNQIL